MVFIYPPPGIFYVLSIKIVPFYVLLRGMRTAALKDILSFYNQKRGGAALNAPLSNHSKSIDEQDSSPAFVRLSIVRLDSRPPALQKHASLTKKRSVTLHSQKKRSVALHSQKLKKCYAARSMAYIRWNNQWIEQGLINKENHGNYRKVA